MQTNLAVERSQIIRWSEKDRESVESVHWKGKGLWRKGFAEEFRMKY